MTRKELLTDVFEEMDRNPRMDFDAAVDSVLRGYVETYREIANENRKAILEMVAERRANPHKPARTRWADYDRR